MFPGFWILGSGHSVLGSWTLDVDANVALALWHGLFPLAGHQIEQ